MKKLLLLCCLLIGASGTASALDILHCTDADAIGFQWQNGQPKATRYVPLNFIVKIVSPTRRIITSPSQEYLDSSYDCVAGSGIGGVLNCTRPNAIASFPISFNGAFYERVGNMSEQIGGAPDLYVAYGACIPF